MLKYIPTQGQPVRTVAWSEKGSWGSTSYKLGTANDFQRKGESVSLRVCSGKDGHSPVNGVTPRTIWMVLISYINFKKMKWHLKRGDLKVDQGRVSWGGRVNMAKMYYMNF